MTDTDASQCLPLAGIAAEAGLVPTVAPAVANISSAAQLVEKIARETSETSSLLDSQSSTRRPRILLGLSGSVATIKLSFVADALLKFADVHIVSSKSALHFFNETELPEACRPILTDEIEWETWNEVGDPVVHIGLRRWADLFLIAPLSANTLAKIANGLCDNLLTCVIRAWDFKKPILVAPAMNTFMWESPFTEHHLTACEKLGIEIIPPVSKKLACGDVGNGAMAAPDDIAKAAKEACKRAGFLVD